MNDTPSSPEGHPISLERAERLLAGDLGDVLRNILSGCCIPVFWFRNEKEKPTILHNGTVTLLKTPKRLLGITAAHVLKAYEKDCLRQKITLQLMNEVVGDVLNRRIAVSKRLDIATFEFDEKLIDKIGKDICPLSFWPPQPPQEGKGIMLAGYPGVDRIQSGRLVVDFALFTAMGIAGVVTDDQITWTVNRERFVRTTKIKPLPLNHNLGGISGGPLISWFEGPSHVTHYRLSGIVSQASAALENVVAKRADFINEDGMIIAPPDDPDLEDE